MGGRGREGRMPRQRERGKEWKNVVKCHLKGLERSLFVSAYLETKRNKETKKSITWSSREERIKT
jgi:hypothetical protein